jgi:hypothetical protein
MGFYGKSKAGMAGMDRNVHKNTSSAAPGGKLQNNPATRWCMIYANVIW